MATRLYVSNAAPDVTPATVRGTWTYSTGSGNVNKLGAKAGSAATYAPAGQAVANTWTQLIARFVSEPLAADTTFLNTDTIQAVIGAKISSVTSSGGTFDIFAYVTQGDSDTPRGTLLNNNVTGTAWTATATGRTLTSTTLSNTVNALAGDRIVVEVGWQKTGTSSSTRTATINYGNTGGTDLTAGSTSVTTQPGWVEFSTAVPFAKKLTATTTTFTETSVATNLVYGQPDPFTVAQAKSGTNGSGDTSVTVSFAQATTAGRTIIAAIHTQGTGVTGVASGANTFTQRFADATNFVYIYILENAPSLTSVTASHPFDGSELVILEVDGLTSNCYDGASTVNVGAYSTAAWSSNAYTPSTTDPIMCVGFTFERYLASLTWTSSWGSVPSALGTGASSAAVLISRSTSGKTASGNGAGSTPSINSVLAGFKCTVSALNNYSLSATATSFTETSVATGLQRSRIFPAAVTAYAENSVSATLKHGYKQVADVTGYFETSVSSGFNRTYQLTAANTSFSETSAAANLKRTIIFPASATAFSETSVSANFRKGFSLGANVASFSESSISAGFRRTYQQTAAVTSFAESSIALALKYGRNLTASITSFAETSIAATLKAARKIASTVTGFIETSIAAILQYGSGHTILANATSFVAASVSTGFRRTYQLASSVTSFSESGVTATLKRGLRIASAVTSFAESGIDSGLRATRKVAVSVSTFAATSISAGLLFGRKLSAQTIEYVLGGVSASLIYGLKLTEYILSASGSLFSLNGMSPTLQRICRLVAESSRFDLLPISTIFSHALVSIICSRLVRVATEARTGFVAMEKRICRVAIDDRIVLVLRGSN